MGPIARLQYWQRERIVPFPRWVDRVLLTASLLAVVWTWL